jgi:bifunctional non-homologous end joining protein LigD
LQGKKLKGGRMLVRMRGKQEAPSKNWLPIKENDKNAGNRDLESASPKSVKSGKKIEEIAGNNASGNSAGRRRTKSKTPARIKGAEKSQLPEFFRPQLATLVDAVPKGENWLHKIKFDGYRIICRIDRGRVSLLTREGQDWTDRFQSIADKAGDLPARQAMLDGEIAALDKDGTTDFQLLQNSMRRNRTANLAYFVFDLLYLDGHDLRSVDLLSRKKLLEKLFDTGPEGRPPLRYSEHWIGQGHTLFDKACAMGLEGAIAKRTDQPYCSGRSRSWVKIKCVKSQEFVIGGYTDPAGSRAGLGALLLGVYDDKQSLHYAGRVGTGFTEQTLTDLSARLDTLSQKSSPFICPPAGRRAKGVHWVTRVSSAKSALPDGPKIVFFATLLLKGYGKTSRRVKSNARNQQRRRWSHRRTKPAVRRARSGESG